MVTQARPSGQTEWSYNRLWWVLVGRSSDQRRQVKHPQELRPEWAVFFVVPYLSGTSHCWSPVVAARWLLGRWLWRWLQANWAWAADVVPRPRILLSFSWTRFGCVFSGGCLPSFSELETYFGLAHSSQLSRPVPGRLLGPRIFLHLTRTRNFFLVASVLISSSRQLMDCLGLAGPGSGPPHFGIFRPSETNHNSLLRARCRVGSMLSSLLEYRDAHEYLNQE